MHVLGTSGVAVLTGFFISPSPVFISRDVRDGAVVCYQATGRRGGGGGG